MFVSRGDGAVEGRPVGTREDKDVRQKIVVVFCWLLLSLLMLVVVALNAIVSTLLLRTNKNSLSFVHPNNEMPVFYAASLQ